jgi:transposase
MKTRGRPVTIRIELSEAQREELRQVAREAVGRVSERAHFVLLSDKGKSVPEIAALMGYTVPTVYEWLRRYQRRGAEGLQDRPRTGRPPVCVLLVFIVAAQLCLTPGCYGYIDGAWTLRLVGIHLRERFQVMVSQSTVRRALRRARFSWGRPKLTLPEGRDPEAAAKLKRLAEVLADKDSTILSADECDVNLLPPVRGTWHPEGRQPKVATPGKNKKRGLFGAVNMRTGEWFYHLTERKRSVEFIGFLQEVVKAYSVGMIYVLVDNCSIHTSKATLKWLASNPRVQLVYLPAYAGHKYNPVEKVWWGLKGALANSSHKTLERLDEAIRRHFRRTTSEGMLALINSPVTRQAQADGEPARQGEPLEELLMAA